jgi:hypothetical protein
LEATPEVVIVKFAVVAPAATVTLAGTCAAAVLLLDKTTTAPPVGAAPAKMTVPVDEVPPSTEVGFTESVLRDLTTARLAVLIAPLFAVIVAVVFAATTLVVAVKVAVVAFAGTVTLAGTCAAAVLLLDSVTTAPPAGAGPVSVTVPVDPAPPGTVVGLSVSELSTAAVTVRLAVCVEPNVAEMVAEALVDTGLVVTVKVAVVALPGTVTLAGTCAAAVLVLDSVTTAPAAGAGPLRVTVPVDEVPPSTEAGFKLTETATGAVTVKLVL